MNAQAIIALVVQFAQLAASIANTIGLTQSPINVGDYATLAQQLTKLVEDARAALTGDDLADLEAALEHIHPDVLQLSAELDAALAKAAEQA